MKLICNVIVDSCVRELGSSNFRWLGTHRSCRTTTAVSAARCASREDQLFSSLVHLSSGAFKGDLSFLLFLSPNANHDPLQTGSVEGSSRAAPGQERVSPLRSGRLHPAPPPLLQPPRPTHTQTEEKESKRIFPCQRQSRPPTDLQTGHSTLVAKRKSWKRL